MTSTTIFFIPRVRFTLNQYIRMGRIPGSGLLTDAKIFQLRFKRSRCDPRELLGDRPNLFLTYVED